MKLKAGHFLTLGLTALAGLSTLSISSCRDKFPSQIDTVFVHDTASCNGSWMLERSNTTSDLVEAEFRDASTAAAVGANGTVITTTDGGANWQTHTPAQSGTLYGVHFFDANNGLVVGDGQSVYRTTNGGASWSSTPLGTAGKLRGLMFLNPTTGFILVSNDDFGISGEIWRTSNAGASWTMVAQPSTGGMYAIAFSNPTHGVAFGKYGTVLITEDAGQSWTTGSMPVVGHTTHIAFVDANTVVAVGGPNSNPTSGYIVRSTDAGYTWQLVKNTTNFMQAVAYNGTNKLTAAGYNGAIAESTDGGLTWTESFYGTDRWISTWYPTSKHAVLIGGLGRVASRMDP